MSLRYGPSTRACSGQCCAIAQRKMPKDMVSLAAHILESKSGHFDPAKFKDEYETALKKLVRRKAKGKPIEPPAEPKEPTNVIDLMDALRKSVAGQRKAPARKQARASKTTKK